MSLDFAIIPITTKFFSTAHDIKDKLINNVTLHLDVQIDTDIATNTQTRISKWRKKHYTIVLVNEDFDETNSIVVLFSGKGSQSQLMEVDDFIDIVSSYEDNTEETNNTNKNTTKKGEDLIKDEEQDESTGGCLIM